MKSLFNLEEHGYSARPHLKPWPKEGTVEHDYVMFTKRAPFKRVDFDGEAFTCFVESRREFDRLFREGRLTDRWNTYRGIFYQVEYVIAKKGDLK